MRPGRPRPAIAYAVDTMPVLNPCDNCGRPFPVYRLAAVILDGRIARVCPRCASTEHERIETPYAPRTDGGANQPSTQREVW
jgi:hypothetical protein